MTATQEIDPNNCADWVHYRSRTYGKDLQMGNSNSSNGDNGEAERQRLEAEAERKRIQAEQDAEIQRLRREWGNG